MQTHKHIWKIFQKKNVVSFVVQSSLAAAVALLFGGATLGVSTGGVQIHPTSSCRDDEQTYGITENNTLNGIAQFAGTGWRGALVQNHIALPNALYSGQGCNLRNQAVGGLASAAIAQREALQSVGKEGKIKIAVRKRFARAIRRHVHRTRASSGRANNRSLTSPMIRLKRSAVSVPATGPGNVFPYGVCTWYADERYHQLHGIYVPWQSNANAWQWTARAYEYGWHVSSAPRVGSIIVLQGGVQGASWLGHVGVVERVMGNGQVVASSMNWGAYPYAVTTWTFSSGPGVTFVSQ